MCDKKIKVLQDAVELFVQDYKGFAWQADRIAVRYFSTNPSQFPTSGDMLNLLSDPCPSMAGPCWSEVINDVKGKSETNLTAIGKGLQSAIDVISVSSMNSGRNPSIVLFSDGMQNVPPLVNEVPESAPSDPYGAADLQIDNTTPTRLDGLGFRINTIGIEATPPFSDLMQNIAAETSGGFEITSDVTADMFPMFIQQVVNALSSRSPQLLAYRRRVLTADTATEAFLVNAGVRRLLLQLSWPKGNRLSFQVFKDGQNVTQAGHIVSGDFYRIFLIDLPAHLDDGELTASGTWKLLISGGEGTHYHVAALVDEPRLKYSLSVGRADYVAGDTIELAAEIRYAGSPVTDAEVSARIGKPGESIGTLLSVNPTPPDTITGRLETAATAAQTKLQLLLEDQGLWQSVQPVPRVLRLESAGDGTYSGMFTDTDVPGSYTVLFDIRGESADIGQYRRSQTQSTFVRFGTAEADESQLRVRTVDQSPEGRTLILHLRPRDRNGEFLGPDFRDRVNVTVAPGSVIGDTRDLVNGGYEITISVPRNTDPAIDITVLGEPLFQGRISDFEFAPFAFSLHAGLSLPHGSFRNSLDAGFGITADMAYRFTSSPVGLEALAGYHRFGGAGSNQDVELVHISGSGKIYAVRGQLAVYVDAGAGVYDLNPGVTDAGVHAGAGAQLNLSRRLALEGLYRLHTVFTAGSNSSFSSVQVGGRVSF